MSVTLRFQSTGAIPGQGEPIEMNGPSLTLGRGDENDVVLPDPDRMLSKRHCVVEDHNGNVVVVDISTNGTFLNYGKVALGTTPTPLNNGDILSVGPYELLVEIAADQSKDPTRNIADPLGQDQVSPGDASAALSAADLLDSPGEATDFLDDLMGETDQLAGPKGVQREVLGDDGLLPPLAGEEDIAPPLDDPNRGLGASHPSHSPSPQDEFAVPGVRPGSNVIPDDWDDDLTADASSPFAKPTPPATGAAAGIGAGTAAFIPEDADLGDDVSSETPDPAPEEAPVAKPPVQKTPPEAISAPNAAEAEAARAFIKALGMEELKIEEDELANVLEEMGHVTRIMIHGLREILMTRTSIKSEFRIDQTQISAGANNPLKFSISPEQAVQSMVKPMTKGYLEPSEAATQALTDIKAHEVAMVTGMEAALKGLLTRLDPKVLEEKIAGQGGLSNVLKSKKARYWEIYEEMFAEISDQAENDFHELFSREFARAYKEQLDRLK